MQGIEYRVDTYDMEERLLAQMLFPENRTGWMGYSTCMHPGKR